MIIASDKIMECGIASMSYKKKEKQVESKITAVVPIY